MIVLGLTGSLGMGKSATARFFAEAGVPVHDADAAVHRLYAGEAAPAIEAAFPGTTGAAGVNRQKLGQRVLGNPPAMGRLETIVHPLVRREELRFLDGAANAGADVAVLEFRCCSKPAPTAGSMASWWRRRPPKCSAPGPSNARA